MNRPNIKNELIKRKYFRFLKEAEGLSESTVDIFNSAICRYEEFTNSDDFVKKFNPDRMIAYKDWLRNRKTKGKVISNVTYHANLRNLRKFFTWLCTQTGYKSKIQTDAIGYLKVKHSEEAMATQNRPREYPEYENVLKVIESINPITEIDKRDRALITFALLTGIRDTAIATLPLKCIDIYAQKIYQDPKLGVKTKFTKYIETTIFRFDEKLIELLKEWIEFLKAKGFDGTDPVFPRSKVNRDEINISFNESVEVEPVFWINAGSIRKIFKKRFEAAGLKYFPPHTFRHLTKALAFKGCKNGEELHAVSQNFGHENLGVTFGSYGNFPSKKLNEVIRNIDYAGKTTNIDEETKELMKKLNEKLGK